VTGLCIDERFLLHRAPSQHPERPERLAAIWRGLEARGLFSRTTPIAARPATDEELSAVHSPQLLRELDSVAGKSGYLDPDTYVAPRSVEIARLAAGGTVDVALAVADGKVKNGLALVRPPGHHATRDQSMGFCLLNNVAIAAAALRRRGLRVAIFDWDVHHGNGTEEIFYDDPDVLYLSTHEWPQYPGTGRAEDMGRGRGVGATVNVPLPTGTDPAAYLHAFSTRILPPLNDFAPDFILVSAGFDAHEADPLGGLRLVDETYVELTRALVAVQPQLAVVLEGGYDLGALERSTVGVLEVLLAVSALPQR
jgi:acetoin utilization deacetylase AcuC-like enzyme